MRYRLIEFLRVLISLNPPGRYAISRFITKILFPHGGIVNGNIGTYRVELDLRDLIQQQAYFGIYEIEETRLIKRLLQRDDIFFDLGANIGYFSFIVSQLIGNSGKVYAFEPITSNVSRIQNTIEKNSINNIIVNPIAVGIKSGSSILYIDEGSFGNSGWASIIKAGRRTTKVEIGMISLDEYIENNKIEHIRLVKIDIEGSELDALWGGKNIFSQENAPDIICEVNPFLLGLANQDTVLITSCLADFGYSLFTINDLSPIKPEVRLKRLTNLFCTKNINQIETLRI